MLPDGRVVVAWVDRFGTASIRARQAAGDRRAVRRGDRGRDPRTGDPLERPSAIDTTDATAVGEALVDMGTWSYGLAFAEALPDGDVGVVHYAAGAGGGTDVRWARLRLDP